MILKVRNNQEFEEWKSIITSKIRNSKSKKPGTFQPRRSSVSLADEDLRGRNVPVFYSYCCIILCL